MKHNYKELTEILFKALANTPEEKSISLRELISICFSDYKYVSASYSEELKKHQNPYSYFNGEKWKHLELIDFTGYFFSIARKSKFYLDNSKYAGGFYGTPENLSFFVRRKPISKRVLFQIKVFSVKEGKKESELHQVKVYYDGAVKCETIKALGFMRKNIVDKNGNMIDFKKPIKKTIGGTYLVNKKIVERIKNIYKENSVKIKTLPQYIENRSNKGYYQEFSFGAKKITCMNICNDSEYGKIILHIFDDIKNAIDSLTPEKEWHVHWNNITI